MQQEMLSNLSSFRIQRSAIKITSSAPLRRGGKADVVQATFQRRIWSRKKQVAVKKLAHHQGADKHRFANEFTHEVELMTRLSHENIARLVGFIEDFKKGQAWIVLSWEPNGNVSEFLARGQWEIPERISLIKDTFEGLNFLHTRQPPICHGDLKSLNILVNASYRAVITDFGSARVIRESTIADQGNGRGRSGDPTAVDSPRIQVVATGNQLTLTGPAWSFLWAPPEVVNGENPGLKSDIWSVGWVCWEVMTNQLPFPDLNSGTAITSRVVQGKVPSASEDDQLSQIVTLCSLMTDCWELDPRDRPSISQCCDEVKWVPSIPPLGGKPLGSKFGTSRLLLQMGRMLYQRARYQDAASLFQHVLHLATSTDDQNEFERAEAAYWLGNIAVAQCKYTEAQKFFTRANQIYDSLGDDLGRANALRGLAGAYHHQSKFDKAEASFTSAQLIYNTVGDDQGQASILCGLGHIYQAQSRYYDKAQDSFMKAQEIYARIGDEQGRADALLGLANVYHLQFQFFKAEHIFGQVHSIYARIGDAAGQANALLGLGNVNCAQSKYAHAESFCNHALEINNRIGNLRGQADARYSLGVVHCHQSKHKAAESFYRKALANYSRIGDNGGGRAKVLTGLAEVYCHRSKYNEAERSYRNALSIYARIGHHDEGQAKASYGLGEVLRYQFKWFEAGSCYGRALNIYTHIGDGRGQAETLFGLGEVYRQQSKYSEAESAYKQALNIYAGLGNDVDQANVCCALGEVYGLRLKYTEAELSYKQAIELYLHIDDFRGGVNALHALKQISHHQSQQSFADSSCWGEEESSSLTFAMPTAI